MSNTLLPPNASPLEVAIAAACAPLGNVPVALRTLWDPHACPVSLLPYLAWAVSVDRWDENWPESAKRSAVTNAFYLHRKKGTIAALRAAVEPFGQLVKVTEWWQEGGAPGTFRVEVGVSGAGLSSEAYRELERMLAAAKPCSRHMVGLVISAVNRCVIYAAAAVEFGDEMVIYPKGAAPAAE